MFKFVIVVISFFFSLQASAHTDHALGNGTGHYLYHVAFFAICLAIVVKAIKLTKAKTAEQNNGK